MSIVRFGWKVTLRMRKRKVGRARARRSTKNHESETEQEMKGIQSKSRKCMRLFIEFKREFDQPNGMNVIPVRLPRFLMESRSGCHDCFVLEKSLYLYLIYTYIDRQESSITF